MLKISAIHSIIVSTVIVIIVYLFLYNYYHITVSLENAQTFLPLVSYVWPIIMFMYEFKTKATFGFDSYFFEENWYQQNEPYAKKSYCIRIKKKGRGALGRPEGRISIVGFEEQYIMWSKSDSVTVDSDLFMFELDKEGKNVVFTKPDKSKRTWSIQELKSNVLKLTIGTDETGIKSKEVSISDVLSQARPI